MPTGTVDARTQHARTGTGRQRSDAPKNYWTAPSPAVQFGREKFRIWWVPGTGPRQRIDDHVETLSWDDATAALTGTIQFRDPGVGSIPDIGWGDEVMVECSLTGELNFTELWRMRIVEPFRDFTATTRTFQLVNALGWLARSTDDFKYAKDKAHPNGWLAHEIVLDLAKKYRVPVGVIAMTTHRIKKLVKLSASPLDVIALAYKREKQYTHKRFVVSCDHGKLNITPLVHSPTLLQLGPTLISASLQQQMPPEFATSVIVRAQGTVQKGKDKKGKKRTGKSKIVVVVGSESAIARYGFIQREVWAYDADTVAEARDAGQRHLVLIGKPDNTLTLTHPGLPQIRRGDAIRALLPDVALRQIIFVSEARHQLTGSDYTTELSVTFSDPFVDARLDKTTEDRYDAARKRGRKAAAAVKQKKPQGAGQRTPGQRLTRRGHPTTGRGGVPEGTG